MVTTYVDIWSPFRLPQRGNGAWHLRRGMYFLIRPAVDLIARCKALSHLQAGAFLSSAIDRQAEGGENFDESKSA
jgi:hypothetical protein